jgi:hypothetical protein
MKPILSILFSALLLPAMAQLSCEEAQEITVGIYMTGTVDGEAPPLICAQNGDQNVTSGLWYTYTAEVDQNVQISTQIAPDNLDVDTRVHVYSGTCGDFTCLAGDDDSGSGPGYGYTSIVNFSMLAGETVYVVFDDRWDDSAFTFEVTASAFVPPPVSFTSVPVLNPNSVDGVVDMNGDNRDDMISVSWNTGEIFISYQNEDGSFTGVNLENNPAQYFPSWSLTAGDIDGNGYNDLIFGGGSGVSFMYANEDGTAYSEVSGPEYVFSQRGNCIDLNNDGNLDVFMCHDVEPNVYYINDGSGNLSFTQGATYPDGCQNDPVVDDEVIPGGLGIFCTGGNYGSIWIDYDSDGDSDLFIAKCRGGGSDAKINELHRNNGDGTFTLVSPELGLDDPVQTWSSAWGDFDNDGDFDVFIGASSSSDGMHKLLENNGDGTFTDITEGSGIDQLLSLGRENVTRDFDNDGYLDLLGAGGALLFNNGDMTFTEVDSPFGNGPTGDLNEDGFIDVVSGGSAWMNGGNENSYLVITPVGTESNLNGIGATIQVYAGDDVYMRQVQSGDGFAYMSSLNVHFGLGDHEAIDSVMISWPSGLVDVHIEPEINTHQVFEEGSSPLSVDQESTIDFLIYPNPAQEILFVDVPFRYANMNYSVFDVTGKLVDQGVVTSNAINISALESGAYVLSIMVDGKPASKKFLKD